MNAEFLSKLEHLFYINDISQYATREIAEKLHAMLIRLQEVNSYMNLTAIREEDGILVKHIADSLKIAPFVPKNTKILDVGCGGGFPSLPLAIARPDISVTSLDSTEKKVNYVGETAKLLGLSNLTTLCGRAEDLAHDPALRESFDAVTARAVASLPVLCELCLPFVKCGGLFIAMKSGEVNEELAASAGGAKKLGASPFQMEAFSLVSHENGIAPEGRTILIAKKQSPSPSTYPRAYAKVKKAPIK